MLGQRAYAVELLVCRLVDVDGSASVSLAAAAVAARGDDVDVDGVSIVVDDGRRREGGLLVVWETLGGEANGCDDLDALGRSGGGEEGEP